ncbi:4079_t:CDS:2, partial [Gigaspora margarita]
SKDQDSDPSGHKISILSKKITKENIRSYPWEIEKSEMHDQIKKCLKKLNQEEALNINYNELICSSIIDTENILEWIRNEFSDKEWNIISNTKKEKNWEKTDFLIVSKAKLFQKKLELLVEEVSNSLWKEKNDKTNRDIYDRIAKAFFKKYSFLNIQLFKNLEIYGIQITGFKMKILCLDKPGFCLYRVRKVDEITIPVKIEDNSIDKVFEKLMYSVQHTMECINDIKNVAKSMKKQAKESNWKKSFLKTISSLQNN